MVTLTGTPLTYPSSSRITLAGDWSVGGCWGGSALMSSASKVPFDLFVFFFFFFKTSWNTELGTVPLLSAFTVIYNNNTHQTMLGNNQPLTSWRSLTDCLTKNSSTRKNGVANYM